MKKNIYKLLLLLSVFPLKSYGQELTNKTFEFSVRRYSMLIDTSEIVRPSTYKIFVKIPDSVKKSIFSSSLVEWLAMLADVNKNWLTILLIYEFTGKSAKYITFVNKSDKRRKAFCIKETPILEAYLKEYFKS